MRAAASVPRLEVGRLRTLVDPAAWHPERLAAAAGDVPIDVWAYTPTDHWPDARIIDEPLTSLVDHLTGEDHGPLRRRVAQLEAGQRTPPEAFSFYSGAIPVDRLGVALAGAIDALIGAALPADARPVADRNLWIGPGGTQSGLHWDGSDGYVLALAGRKSVVLCPPLATRFLYPMPTSSGPRSAVDAHDPDLERHPDFASVDSLRMEIGPGDLLFIPRGWWHSLRSIDEHGVSVNAWLAAGSDQPSRSSTKAT